MLRQLIEIRRFEEKTIQLYAQARIWGYLHPSLGGEAVAVGACQAISENDYIISKHRGHGHSIAKGADLNRMMAELLGKATGYYGVGESVPREKIVRELLEGGYRSVPLVEDQGEFSVRGAILDLFPPNWDQGCRLEFFGDEIDSIRKFDPQTQRSLQNMEEVIILPVREVLLNQDRAKRMTRRLKEAFQDSALYKTHMDMICERLDRLETFAGIEFYLPYIYQHTDTI